MAQGELTWEERRPKPQGPECTMPVGSQINALSLSVLNSAKTQRLSDLFTPRGHFNFHLSVALCQRHSIK